MIDFSEYLTIHTATIVSADFGRDPRYLTLTDHLLKVDRQIGLFYLLALVIIRLIVFLQRRLLSDSCERNYGECNLSFFAICLGKCELIINSSCINLIIHFLI